jgi:hypothetical protein
MIRFIVVLESSIYILPAAPGGGVCHNGTILPLVSRSVKEYFVNIWVWGFPAKIFLASFMTECYTLSYNKLIKTTLQRILK